MHLTGGLAADGTRVLSEASVAAMADHQADLPGQVHPRRLVGPGLDPLRLGRPPADRPRRQHPRPGGVPADPARGRASRSRCSPTAATPATSTRTSTARSSPSSPASRCREPFDAARASRSTSTSRRTSAPTSARRCAMEVLVGDDGPTLRTTISARSPSWCPTRSRSTRWSPVGPALFAVQPAGGGDLGAGDASTSCRPASATSTSASGPPRGSD